MSLGNRRNVLIYGLLTLLVLQVLLPVAPYLQPVPAIDSSVFLYVGDRVLAGDIPYKDVWDHKGPLIYYINALGLEISGGSRWGVWLIEWIFVVAAAWIGYCLMERAFGGLPAILASGFFLSGLSAVLHGGNMTEEYALPLQFSLLWFFYRNLKSPKWLLFFLIGVFAALSFSLRPNIIAIPLAIGLYCLWRAVRTRERANWIGLAIMAAGGLVVVALVTLYFVWHGALQDLWDAVIRYNLAYTATRSGRQVIAIITGFGLLPIMLLFGLVGWGIAIFYLRNAKKNLGIMAGLLSVLIISLPLEFILTGVANRNYQHYYMSWLPVLSLCSAFLFYYLDKRFIPSTNRTKTTFRVFALCIFFVLVFSPILTLIAPAATTLQEALRSRGLPAVDFTNNPYEPSLIYVYNNTYSDDYLLFWGNNLAVQWITKRVAPTRFAYQSAFAVEGFVNDKMVAELINELKSHSPMIIDTTINNDPVPALSQLPENVAEVLRPLFQYIHENYAEVDSLFKTDWIVYRYVGSTGECIP